MPPPNNAKLEIRHKDTQPLGHISGLNSAIYTELSALQMEGFARCSRGPGTVQDIVVAFKMLCLVAILHRLKGESHVPSESKCRLSYEDTHQRIGSLHDRKS